MKRADLLRFVKRIDPKNRKNARNILDRCALEFPEADRKRISSVISELRARGALPSRDKGEPDNHAALTVKMFDSSDVGRITNISAECSVCGESKYYTRSRFDRAVACSAACAAKYTWGVRNGIQR